MRNVKATPISNHEPYLITNIWTLCSCHLCLHACNLLLFARGLSIDSRAYVISQHVRWPIRAPLPTCANQDAWAVITPKRTKANSIHTATWHTWTRTPPLNFVLKAVFSLVHFPPSFICLWPLRRDYRSGVLIGTGGERRSDWPARVLANDVSTRIDSPRAKSNRLHACRHKWQLQSVQMLVIK